MRINVLLIITKNVNNFQSRYRVVSWTKTAHAGITYSLVLYTNILIKV